MSIGVQILCFLLAQGDQPGQPTQAWIDQLPECGALAGEETGDAAEKSGALHPPVRKVSAQAQALHYTE